MSNCNTPNHFSSVCRQPKRDSASAIIAHVNYDEESDFFTSATPSREVWYIPARVTPLVAGNQIATSTVQVFPDSGADICLAGTRHLNMIGVEPKLLTPCRKTITAVGGPHLSAEDGSSVSLR